MKPPRDCLTRVAHTPAGRRPAVDMDPACPECYPAEGNALWNMSLALDGLGDRSEAIARGEAALGIYERTENPAADKVRKQLEEWRG